MDPHFQPDGLPEYETRHRHHVNWCREWQIDQLFAAEDDEPGDEPVISAAEIDRKPGRNPLFSIPAYDSDPAGFEPGSIRLLSYSVTGESGRPTYVLLLGEWHAGWSWFMPFSTYTAPATDWELLSELDPEPLQVLQVWNARSCPDEILERSWLVTHVGASLVNEAQSLYGRMVTGDGTASLGFVGRIGTRVLDPSDPRMEYLKAESARLDYLTGLALAHQEADVMELTNVVQFIVPVPRKSGPLVLAAATESPDRELAYYIWQVVGTSIQIHLMELLEVTGAYTLRIDGDADELLEGAKVFDGPTVVLAEIHAGQSGSKDNPLRINTQSLGIQLADGQFVRLEYVDESP
jgi:hypothetical protein